MLVQKPALAARSRSAVVAASGLERRQIFQTCPPCGDVSYVSIVDAMQLVDDMPSWNDRVDYCTTLGIDYCRVVEYYSIVRSMDALYVTPSSRDPAASLRRPTPPLLPADARRRPTAKEKRTFVLMLVCLVATLVRSIGNVRPVGDA